MSLTVLCLFLPKFGKLQFAASFTRSNLMPDFKQHGNILLGSLLIFLSMTLGLKFLATWILAFFMYYSDFIPYEYEQEIGKTSHLLRQNSSVPLKKNPPAFQLLSLKFLCVLPTDYLFYCHTDNKSSRKDHSARK